MDDVEIIGPVSEPDECGHRVGATIRVGAWQKDLWYQASRDDLADLLDPFVAVCLVPAMKRGGRVVLRGPASAEFLAQVQRIQRIFELYREDAYHEGRHRLRRVEVVPREQRPPVVGTGAAMFFSGGVDSLYSAVTHPEIRHGIFIDDFDGFFPAPVRDVVHDNAAQAAAELGIELVRLQTNAKTVTMAGLGPAGPPSSWRLVGGSVQEGAALLLAPAFDRVLFPSSEAVGYHTRFGDGPILEPLYSAGGQRIEHDDILVNRFEKTRRLAHEAVARSHLRVCWQPALNCGRCPKCVRTMLALEALGVRDRFTTFPWCTSAELAERVVDIGRHSPETTWRYYDEVGDFLDDAGERPDLRRAIADARVVERTIGRDEALAALAPASVRRVVRRVRRVVSARDLRRRG